MSESGEYQAERLRGDDGLIHIAFGEYTLCGVATDEYCAEPGSAVVTRGTISCPICARMLVSLKGFRASPAAFRDERSLTDLHIREV